MDPFYDPINGILAFEEFDANNIDVSLIADQHLFDNGPDLFCQCSSSISGESMASAQFGSPIASSVQGTSLGTDILSFSDHELFFNNDNNLGLCTKGTFNPGLEELTLDQSALRSMAQQPHRNHGLVSDSAFPESLELPALTFEPAMIFNQEISSSSTQLQPQIILASVEEQRLWQDFKQQKTHNLQLQPEVPQAEQIQAFREWKTIENEFTNLDLEPHFEVPSEDMGMLSAQNLMDSNVSPNAQQVPHFSVHPHLSDEQVRLLQITNEIYHVDSSVDVLPADVVLSRNEQDLRTSPRSHNVHVRRRGPSPYLEAPDSTRVDTQSQTQLTDLTFVSLKDAEAAMPSRYMENPWEPPHPDNTIPNTQGQRAHYVLAMFQAFQDTSECKDNKNGHSYLKRWKDGNYYNLQSMEKVCWHMLDIAERLHTHGPSATVMYCEEALKKLKGSRNLTFEQRVHAICAMLKFSKHLCDQLMKGEELESLVGAPKQKMSGATTMQVQNQRRQKWIVHGRTGDPLHTGPDENDSDEQNNNISQSAPFELKLKDKRAKSTISRVKTKARPNKVSRDETDGDDEMAYRRQSDSSMVRDEDVEMADELQHSVAPAQSEVDSPSAGLTPVRKRKIEKASKKGKVTMMYPLVMIANRACKPIPKSQKRKMDDGSTPESSKTQEMPAPTKRSKINNGSSKCTDPARGNSGAQRKSFMPEDSSDDEGELDFDSEFESEFEFESK